MTVSRFLPRLGVNGMMIAGASLVGLQLAAIAFGPGWKIQALSLLLMGWGFYMIHGCLQVFASELSVEARATALSLHSFFFFMGQTVGPIAYGLRHPACRQDADPADERRHHGRARLCLRAAAAAAAAGGCADRLTSDRRRADPRGPPR